MLVQRQAGVVLPFIVLLVIAVALVGVVVSSHPKSRTKPPVVSVASDGNGLNLNKFNVPQPILGSPTRI